MRWLYSLLMWLAQPLLRRKLARRGLQEPGYREAVPERFGHYSTQALASDGRTLWVHAVALGETRAAAGLVSRLRARWPGLRLLLTNGSATGRAEGAKLLQPGDIQVWQPWDTPGATQRFLAQFKPSLGLLMETEIWPNLVVACQQAGVPLVLANARMSDKSASQARRLAWLARPAFRGLTAAWAQTQADAAALAGLGAPVRGVFGNLKFDAEPNPAQCALGRTWRAQAARPVVMLASSREGEEAALLDVLESFRALDPVSHALGAAESRVNHIQWLIVPRHPQRFDEVAALAQTRGFQVLRRSAWPDGPPARTDAAPVLWLGDSLGEMALYYSLADVALLGGSFAPLGGQNLIEAAACGCPVVMGPHTFNFAEASELAVSARAAIRVHGMPEAVQAVFDLLSKSAAQRAMAVSASGFAQTHRGAVDKTVAAVLALRDQQGVDPV
jgi:3-deoxy-D-manno-octulosonic-acid transferase